MSEVETRQARFSSPEQPEELKEYRRLSLFAISAFVFGLLSITALAHPILWLLPLLAIILATIALIRIQQGGDLAGRPLAVIGLALALLFGSCSVTWTWAREATLSRQAQSHVEHWFNLLAEGQFLVAHQLTKAPYERLTPQQSLEEYYAGARREWIRGAASSDDHAGHDHAGHDHAGHDHGDHDHGDHQKENPAPAASPTAPDGPMMPQQVTPKEELEGLYGVEPLQSILAQKGKFDLTFLETVAIGTAEADATIVDQRYLISYPEAGRTRERTLEVRMQRRIRNGRAQWNLVHVHELLPTGS